MASVSRPNRLSKGGIYRLLTRVTACVWFLVLAIVLARSLIDMNRNGQSNSSVAWVTMISRACIFLFYFALSWLMLVRPRAHGKSGGLTANLIAFLGTYSPWTFVFLPRRAVSSTQHLAAAGILMLGGILILYVIRYLGRSFSIVPEARRLVTHGPYAIVRHPLYVAEEIGIAGLFLDYGSLLLLPLLLVHAAIQIQRTQYEERVLRREFPEYDAYAARTARFIPFVW